MKMGQQMKDSSHYQEENTNKKLVCLLAHTLCQVGFFTRCNRWSNRWCSWRVAYAINLEIYKSTLSAPVKILLSIVTGLAAIAIWFGLAVMIHLFWK
jgi:hypothetical protein